MLLILLLWPAFLSAQSITISGYLVDMHDQHPLDKVRILSAEHAKELSKSDRDGRFEIQVDSTQVKTLDFFCSGYSVKRLPLSNLMDGYSVIRLSRLSVDLSSVPVRADESLSAMRPMPAVVGSTVYKGMKSEEIQLSAMTVNLNNGTARQVYSRVAGLNIWENDGAGMQLGIGGRGLSPNRTSHFNVRQDLNDISADALGYPESYYTPSLLAVERIQLVRGTAALQYGSQFGGLLNFQMISPPEVDTTSVTVGLSIGGFGPLDTLHSSVSYSNSNVKLSHRSGDFGLAAFYQFKKGEGWRDRSAYDVHMMFASLLHDFSDRSTLRLDLTHMDYLSEQAGGLTDNQFEVNPRQISRERNWFGVDWNIASLRYEYTPNEKWNYEGRLSGLFAERSALGHLGQVQRPDPLLERDLIQGRFGNLTHESRLLHRRRVDNGYQIFSGGLRLYKGNSHTRIGLADADQNSSFDFIPVRANENSDYRFPNWNAALFVQSIIPISGKLSITPGLRYEYIDTRASGTFDRLILDGASNVIEDTVLTDDRSRSRDFILFGIGASWQLSDMEIYANAVQNYRAVNFSDIQVRTTSLRIDPEIRDERGHNLDIGVRGRPDKKSRLDVSLFYLQYADRIGEYFTVDELNRPVRFRSNVSDARTLGIEFMAEREFVSSTKHTLSLFVSGSFVKSEYFDSDISAFDGNQVELVPTHTVRTALDYRLNDFSFNLQFSLVGDQFSDATNVGSDPDFPSTVNAVDGIIPMHTVMDFSMKWSMRKWKADLSINNLMNTHYFTRRASGYPGPGIIPAEGRSFTLGLSYSFGF